ncbi:MAG: hypothetical protein PHP48_09975, partial [Bacteroidales bacterium]|nr:hypothetical protein [Bacteroidales bacterium]
RRNSHHPTKTLTFDLSTFDLRPFDLRPSTFRPSTFRPSTFDLRPSDLRQSSSLRNRYNPTSASFMGIISNNYILYLLIC